MSQTKFYGVLAYPAKHSLSPAIHNAAFKALGLEMQFDYFEIPENELVKFMNYVKQEPVSGLAVSLPYKEVVMNYINEIDADALKIGAVNTVVNKDGILYGYNTDWIGVLGALKEVVEDIKGKKIVVIGAGGAARAVIYAALKEEAEVAIYNRTAEKAHKLADYFGKLFKVMVGSGSLEDMLKDSGEILINTTSSWIINKNAKLEELMPEDYVGKFKIMMDIVYKPLVTPLIEAARKRGLGTVTGDKMFLYQAAEQFKLWTGKKAPLEVMGAVLVKKCR